MMERHLSAAIQMGDYKTGVKSEAFLIQLDWVQYVLHSASQYHPENLSQDDQVEIWKIRCLMLTTATEKCPSCLPLRWKLISCLCFTDLMADTQMASQH